MQVCVLMAVTTLLRSWNDCNTFELMQRRFPNIGVSLGFIIVFIVFIVCLTRSFGCCVCGPPFSLFPIGSLLPRTSDGQPFFICLYRADV